MKITYNVDDDTVTVAVEKGPEEYDTTSGQLYISETIPTQLFEQLESEAFTAAFGERE